MNVIQSKAEVKQLLEKIIHVGNSEPDKLVAGINTHLLTKKIRFPLLEYASRELYQFIPDQNQNSIADKIIELHSIGGNVLAGIILQLRLKEHFAESHQKAIEYIIKEDLWYVCDIIGERVIGYSLLTYPKETIPILRSYTRHSDKWVVRSIGVATHYAVKNGLKKVFVEEVFQVLLSCSGTTEFHTKKGIGWAVKTIAKFHPEIIEKYRKRIEKNTEIKQWFRTKIKLGLSRSFKYASRYSD
jgi:3-methyladenine DNA glycosylase AlkD